MALRVAEADEVPVADDEGRLDVRVLVGRGDVDVPAVEGGAVEEGHGVRGGRRVVGSGRGAGGEGGGEDREEDVEAHGSGGAGGA